MLGKHPYFYLDIKVHTERHGSEYGGWDIFAENMSSSAIVYSYGVGEDTSFEESLLTKYSLRIEAWDPTPRSALWVSSRKLASHFRFHEFGLGARDEMRLFYLPSNPKHVSLSIINPKCDVETVSLPLRRLSTCMKLCGDSDIDILKLDIEGAEYEVIDDIVRGVVRPKQLLVEFHHRFNNIGIQKTLESVAALRSAGYRLFSLSNNQQEMSFLHGHP